LTGEFPDSPAVALGKRIPRVVLNDVPTAVLAVPPAKFGVVTKPLNSIDDRIGIIVSNTSLDSVWTKAPSDACR
jgi:hypothetical protein